MPDPLNFTRAPKPPSQFALLAGGVATIARRLVALEKRPAPTNGRDGPQGAVGPEGAMGPQGVPGETGPRGLQGETGAQGIPGVAGEQGARGEQGERGLEGSQGVMGPPGEMGSRGEQGVQGIQGERGETGPRGADGTAGRDGADGMSADVDAMNDVLASLRAIVADARTVRGETALEKVISGLDMTIQSINAPKEIVRDANGKPIAIRPKK